MQNVCNEGEELRNRIELMIEGSGDGECSRSQVDVVVTMSRVAVLIS